MLKELKHPLKELNFKREFPQLFIAVKCATQEEPQTLKGLLKPYKMNQYEKD